MTRLVFLDTETTGLDPDRHEIWDLAYIIRDENHADVEHSLRLPVEHLNTADPFALRIGRYHDRIVSFPSPGVVGASHRRDDGATVAYWPTVETVASHVAQHLDGATIVGAVPDFDVRFLTRWLNAHGQPWTGHYHLCDVENLAVGFLASELADARRTSTVTTYDPNVIVPPWSSDALAKELGVTIEESARHTALGDARWARDMYDAVMGFA